MGVYMVICPYCNKEYDKDEIIVEKIRKGLMTNDYRVFSCPKCKKILSCAFLY